jgi:hypothetical protein
MSEVDILYQISNLKEIDYNNTLVLTSLVELLIEKGIITRRELINKTKEMDSIAVTVELD